MKRGEKVVWVCVAVVLVILAVMWLCGCETKTVSGPDGWRAEFNRVLVENSFDKAVIAVEPNGAAVITLEKYKSDGTRALETLEKVIAVGGGAAAGAAVP